jgi:hypothetical protein
MNPRLKLLKDELVKRAGELGKSVEDHAAAELAQAHVNWQRVCAIAVAVAFIAGAAMGWNLHP